MDFTLTQTYRKIYHDIVLIYDVIRYCQRRKLSGNFWSNFADGLAFLMSTEDQELDSVPVQLLSASTLETEHERKQIQWEVFVEFLHSVVLQFSMEELSQFPFWSAKIVTAIANDSITTTDSGKSMSAVELCRYSMYSVIAKPFTTMIAGGPIALYEGCLPFLSAAVIYNFSQLQVSVQRFMTTIMSIVPQSTLKRNSSRSHILEVQQYQAKAQTKQKSSSSSFSFSSILLRSTIYALMHPFLSLSVRIVADPYLRRRNWMHSLYTLLVKEGPLTLFSGIRNTILLSLNPFSAFLFGGVPDTILYHVLLNGPAMRDSKDSLLVATNCVLTSKGFGGFAVFGFMTFAQAIPGFLSFLSSRFTLWMLFGTTKQRRRQVSRRRQMLDEHFTSTMPRIHSAKNFHATPMDDFR